MVRSSGFEIDLGESFPHLDNAPAIEAVIHWRARISRPWEQSEIQRRLEHALPDYPQSAQQRTVEFEAGLAPEHPPLPSRRDYWQGFRLTSADGLQIAQFLRDGLGFSRLRPYTEWDSFSAEGLRLWGIFAEIGFPKEIERLGVRFVNRVVLTELDDFRKLLANPPDCLEPFGFPLAGFLYQSTHDVPGLPFRINVVRAIQSPNPAEESGHSLIVDIDVSTTRPLECDTTVIIDHLTKMHWLKNKAFFNLFSQTAIELFGAIRDTPLG